MTLETIIDNFGIILSLVGIVSVWAVNNYKIKEQGIDIEKLEEKVEKLEEKVDPVLLDIRERLAGIEAILRLGKND